MTTREAGDMGACLVMLSMKDKWIHYHGVATPRTFFFLKPQIRILAGPTSTLCNLKLGTFRCISQLVCYLGQNCFPPTTSQRLHRDCTVQGLDIITLLKRLLIL